MRSDGQTDMTNLIVAFRNFANAPKNIRWDADCWTESKRNIGEATQNYEYRVRTAYSICSAEGTCLQWTMRQSRQSPCSSARSAGPINASGHGNPIHCLVIIPVYSSMTTVKINLAQEFSRKSVTTEVRVRPHIIPCGICGGRVGTVTGSSRVFRNCLLKIIPPKPHRYSFITKAIHFQQLTVPREK